MLTVTRFVKRATPNASHVAGAEFIDGAKILHAKLARLQPRVICFNGKVGYQKAFDRHATFGPPNLSWGESRFYLIPSTSPANARYRRKTVD